MADLDQEPKEMTVALCGLWWILGGVAGFFALIKSIIKHGLASPGLILLLYLYLIILFVGLTAGSFGLFLKKRRATFTLMATFLLMVPVVQSNTISYQIMTPMTFYFIYSDLGCTEKYDLENNRVQTCKTDYSFRIAYIPHFIISLGSTGELFKIGFNIIPLLSFYILWRHLKKD